MEIRRILRTVQIPWPWGKSQTLGGKYRVRFAWLVHFGEGGDSHETQKAHRGYNERNEANAEENYACNYEAKVGLVVLDEDDDEDAAYYSNFLELSANQGIRGRLF
ncbi:hypothetical protein G7Y89_g13447 [Cudoniella acicularis]|uniref:Uncharacterized protein n=1 Tax=Cudoniella acicularis TaxID=354080 RepID=A0A8H4VYP0_9HELO|nr:hypothetical protein G7Y89_g13447 [Cudoniella acicularis]